MSILCRTNLQYTIRPLYCVGKVRMLGNVPIRGLFRKSSSWAKETIKRMTLPAIAVLAWTDVGLWSIFTYLYYHDKVSHLVEYLSDNSTDSNQSSHEGTKGGFLAKYFDLQTDTKLVEGIAFGCIARKLLFPLPFKVAISMFMGGVFTYSKLLYMMIMVPLWATFFYILLSFINYDS